MNVAYLSSETDKVGPASTQTIKDFEAFAEQMGFSKFVLNTNFLRIFQIVANLNRICKHDFVIIPYPYIGNPLGRNAIMSLRKNIETNILIRAGKKTHLIIFVVDLPIDQNIYCHNIKPNHFTYCQEQKLFETAHAICVFNENMKKKIISRYQISDKKFVEFELLDYGSDLHSILELNKYRGKRFKIVYGGALGGERVKHILENLPYSKKIDFVFIGKNGEYVTKANKPNISYLGYMPPQQYIDYISKNAHFGIVEKENPYYELSSTSKFSSYMLAGVPVLVPKNYEYLSRIVDKYGVGLVYNELSEIPTILGRVDLKQCVEFAENAFSLGQKLKAGTFFKTALDEAMSHRKDSK